MTPEEIALSERGPCGVAFAHLPRCSSLKNRLLLNSLWNVLAYCSCAALTFISLPFFIKCLGKSQYGVLVLLGSLGAPFGLLNFSFGQATVKFVAESLATRDISRACRYVGNSLLFNLGTGFLAASVLVVCGPLLSAHVFNVSVQEARLIEECLFWAGLSLVVAQCSATFSAVPTALQRLGVVSITSVMLGIVNLLVSIGVLFLGYGLVAVVQARCVVSCLGLLTWLCLAKWHLPSLSFRPAYDRAAFRGCLKFGAGQTAANAGGILANHSDKYLLGIYLSPEAVAIFNVPALIFSTLFTIVTKLGESTFPAISDLEGRRQKARAVDVLLRAGVMLTLAMICLQGTVFVFAHDFLRLYMGTELANSAAYVLQIFSLTAVIAAPSVMMNQFLLGTGATFWIGVTSVAGGALTFLVSWVLIPRFGLSGAAWSDLVAILLSRPLIHWLIWRRELHHNTSNVQFVPAFYGLSIVGVPVTILLGWVRHQIPWQPGWTDLVAGGVLAMLLLAGMLLFSERWLPSNSLKPKNY
jgi:O-antigen/teichoic acid export membrane protein